METTLGEYAVKIAEMITKDLKYYVNIVDKLTYHTLFTTKVQRSFDIKNFIKEIHNMK